MNARGRYALHVVEGMEEWAHEALDLLKEDGQLLLHGVVVILIISARCVKLLLKLEQVLLVLERLFLLLLEFGEGVVEAIEIYELMVSLRNVLADRLEALLKLGERSYDSGLDEVDFGGEDLAQLVHHLLIVDDVRDSRGCGWMTAVEVGFSAYWVEEDREGAAE